MQQDHNNLCNQGTNKDGSSPYRLDKKCSDEYAQDLTINNEAIILIASIRFSD